MFLSWHSIIPVPPAFLDLLLEHYPTCQIRIDCYNGHPLPIVVSNRNLTSLSVNGRAHGQTASELLSIVLDVMLRSSTLRRLNLRFVADQSTNANLSRPPSSFPFRSRLPSDPHSTSEASPHAERVPALETLELWGYEFCDDDIEYWADRSDWSHLRTLRLFRTSTSSALASGFLVHAAQRMTALTVLEMALPAVAAAGSSPSTSNSNADSDRSSVSAAIIAVQATLMDLTLTGDYCPHLHAISECRELRMLSLHMLESERRMMTNDDLMMIGMGCAKLEEICVDLDPEVRAELDIDHYDKQHVRTILLFFFTGGADISYSCHDNRTMTICRAVA